MKQYFEIQMDESNSLLGHVNGPIEQTYVNVDTFILSNMFCIPFYT